MQWTDEASDIIRSGAGKQHQHPAVLIRPNSINLNQNTMRLPCPNEVVVDPDCLARQELVSIRLNQLEPILRQR